MRISYSLIDCTLGKLLVARTDRGICAVTLGDTETDLIKNLKAEFVNAAIAENNKYLRDDRDRILNSIGRKNLNLPLDIRGTAFQQQVWQALRQIPYGETRNYAEIAKAIDKPKATRAVGSACGANPVALIIPCHRVLRSDGNLSGYRWGIDRKRKLLEMEQHLQMSLF